MKHTLTFMLAALSLVTAESTLGQGSSPNLAKRLGDVTLAGHIVLYDWVQHEMTSADDFVVEITTAEGKDHRHYARILYKPLWGGWDAPPASPKDV
jgi:hypothetical protein